MLRADVVAAAEKGLFHVWPIATVDEAVELLTGVPAGARGEDGVFPEGSVNRRADDRLARFAERARSFARGGAGAVATEAARAVEAAKDPEPKP
jgi:predicted ATP-dependent protease